MIDPDDIAQAAANRLQVPAADLTTSATAALEYIAWDNSTTVDDLNPDSALLFEGARLLCERIYQDVSTRTGEMDALGMVTMSGVMIPENLGKHLRHYWSHEQRAWGIG